MNAKDEIHILGLYERTFVEENFYELYDECVEEIEEEYPEFSNHIQFAIEDDFVLFYTTKEINETNNYL